MTKKDFIALADVIREHNETMPSTPFKRAHLDTLAQLCQSQNPRFNRQFWLDYIEEMSRWKNRAA